MEPFHVAHLIVLGMWLGVVITEVLFEFTASDADSLRAAARFHYNVDKYGEVPILLAVLITGAILTARAWPLTTLHVVKIGLSLVAVALALTCTLWVFRRRRIRGRKRAAWIPAADLEPGGGRHGLRDARPVSRVSLFPPLMDVAKVLTT